MSTGDGRRATIFLIEEDDDTRRLLKENLQRASYRVLLAVDEEDALDRVGGTAIHADLVLVTPVGKSTEEALGLGRRVREHAKFDETTPLIVMPERYGKDVEGTDVNVEGNDWVTYPEEHTQLENLIDRLLSKRPG